MKRVNLLLVALALFFAGHAETVNVTTAGTLRSTLVANSIDPATVTNLVITGTINAQDFKDLRDSIPMLLNLDLSAANIVAYTGTDHPKSTSSTAFAANVLPDNSFSTSAGTTPLQTIKLPASLVKVSDYAFAYSKNLVSVEFNGTSLTTIGRNAFYKCIALTSIALPNSITEVGAFTTANSRGSVFRDCTALTSVVWSTSAPVIELYTFANCTALTSITGTENVTTVNKNAFQYAGNVNVNFGTSLATADSLAFTGSSIVLNVDAANTAYSTTDGVLFNKDASKLLFCPANKTSYTIPSTVKKIGGYAFSSGKIQSVVIPASVEAIYAFAFNMCPKLTSVDNTNATYSYIGKFAFERDSALSSFTIPRSVTLIDQKAFQSSGLNSINIPANVTAFGDYAFAVSPLLTTVTFEATSATVTNWVGKYVFLDCYKLAHVTLPPTLTNIPDGSFSFHNPMLGGAYTTALESITIPEGVTNLGQGAFAFSGVLKSISLPSTLKTIASSNFYKCSMLKNIVLPEGLETIGGSVFSACDSVKNLVLPSTLKTIDQLAFDSYYGNTSFNIPASVTSLNARSFSGTNANLVVDPNNATYASVNNVIYTKDMTAVIGTSGNQTGTYAPPASVTSIGDYAFYKNTLLSGVSIPSAVTFVGANAFGNCSGITSVYVGNATPLVKQTSTSATSGIRSTAFTGVTLANVTLYVPTYESLVTYQSDAYWGTFGNFVNGFVTANENPQAEMNGKLTLNVYPNPATEGITIQNASSDNFMVSIYNLNGKLVQQLNASNGQYISLENLSSGVYFLKIAGESVNQKLIKL